MSDNEKGWRVGHVVGSTFGRTLYKDGKCVGMVDAKELAAELVAATKASADLWRDLNDILQVALPYVPTSRKAVPGERAFLLPIEVIRLLVAEVERLRAAKPADPVDHELRAAREKVLCLIYEERRVLTSKRRLEGLSKQEEEHLTSLERQIDVLEAWIEPHPLVVCAACGNVGSSVSVWVCSSCMNNRPLTAASTSK
jgi:hypothetical protein